MTDHPLSSRSGTNGSPVAQEGLEPRVRAPLDSAWLLGDARTVAISHNGAIYRLQATRQGKLILTK